MRERGKVLPANITDVAGLVPDAHLGKGMGNQFLNDLMQAEALIQVVDLSGKTDMQGDRCEYSNPAEDVKIKIRTGTGKLASWDNKEACAHNPEGPRCRRCAEGAFIGDSRSAFSRIQKAGEQSYLNMSNVRWKDEDIYRFSDALIMMEQAGHNSSEQA